jgi:hypothetical protein
MTFGAMGTKDWLVAYVPATAPEAAAYALRLAFAQKLEVATIDKLEDNSVVICIGESTGHKND